MSDAEKILHFLDRRKEEAKEGGFWVSEDDFIAGWKACMESKNMPPFDEAMKADK